MDNADHVAQFTGSNDNLVSTLGIFYLNRIDRPLKVPPAPGDLTFAGG
jgi:hypothetical protein